MVLELRNFTEGVSFLVGLVIVLTTGPFVGVVVGSTVLWEAIDRGFRGGLTESGQELTGFIFARCIPLLERLTRPFNVKLVKNAEDCFMVNSAIWYSFGLPLLLTTCGSINLKLESFAAKALLFWAYHVFRIGPFFMNFAYVYTLCHKEGHAMAAGHGLWRPPFDRHGPFRYLFNWWVGLYYGVMPASFAVGHSINHHKYNNGPADVISTADKPRDEWMALVAYIPRFVLYATNISTVKQFISEGKYRTAFSTVFGSLYYFAFVALVAHHYGWAFAFAYLAYPFFEQCLMLSGINWVWHSFIDPSDVENEYVMSITILGGTINVLNEDSHVVHHQYPGFHWSRHPKLLTKHADEYKRSLASVFYGTHTFELLALILLADYEKLADRFIGQIPSNTEKELFGCGTHDPTKVERPSCPISHAEAVELLKSRLRACWWGPRSAIVNKNLLQESAGESFAYKHEWEVNETDAGFTAGAEPARAAPAAAPMPAKQVVRRKRSSASPVRVR